MVAAQSARGEQLDGARITRLAALTRAVSAGEPEAFAAVVKAAYAAGASREELLGAVEVARVLAGASGAVVVQAYAAIHAWHWIAARRRA